MLSLPKQGENYVVKEGDYLRLIASMAYGNEMEWGIIADANGIPRTKAADLIYPGRVLYIPPKGEKIQEEKKVKENRYSDRPKNKVTVLLEGHEVYTKRGRFGCGIDVLASSYNAEVAWMPGKQEWLDKACARGSYAKSELYIGAQLVCTGRLYARENKISNSGITKTLEFYSVTADIVDSCIPPAVGEIRDGDLETIAKKLLEMHGYPVTFIDGSGALIENPARRGVETVAKYLQGLSAQRGLFISCDETGGVVFQKLASSGKPVANIEYKKSQVTEYKARYDDRQRYSKYHASAVTGDGEALNATAVDPQVPASRQILFESNESNGSNIQAAAEWKMLRIELEALSINIPVSTWYDGNGELWKPNTIVTVKAPVLDIPEEKNYIIKQAEFIWEADARKAELNLVPMLEVSPRGELQSRGEAKKEAVVNPDPVKTNEDILSGARDAGGGIMRRLTR